MNLPSTGMKRVVKVDTDGPDQLYAAAFITEDDGMGKVLLINKVRPWHVTPMTTIACGLIIITRARQMMNRCCCMLVVWDRRVLRLRCPWMMSTDAASTPRPVCCIWMATQIEAPMLSTWLKIRGPSYCLLGP